MKPHQERVVAEREELDSKRIKLQSFIGSEMFLSLDKDEQARLLRQSKIMNDYSCVLIERIGAFEL